MHWPLHRRERVDPSTRPWSVRSLRAGRESGQAAPLALLSVMAAGGVLLALVPLGRATIDRADARTAADAAALAGAADGSAAARAVARANGGDLVSFDRDDSGATVVVGLGDAIARARAQSETVAAGPDRAGLAPAMIAAISRAEQLLGRPITIVSGFRSRAEQQRLWDRRAVNPYPVARPGTSRHESGLAIDVPTSLVADLRRVASAAGLCFPLPVSDPVHFELCRWNPN